MYLPHLAAIRYILSLSLGINNSGFPPTKTIISTVIDLRMQVTRQTFYICFCSYRLQYCWLLLGLCPNEFVIGLITNDWSIMDCLILPKWLRIAKETGPRLNIKTVLSTYGDFHVKDKTAVRTSYL